MAGKIEKRWPPPFFKLFASDISQREAFKLASMSERGLFLSMLAYCWSNDSIPAGADEMASMLGVRAVDREGLDSRLIREFFTAGAVGRLKCEELDSQKAEFKAFRNKLAKSGSKGGATTQAKIRAVNTGKAAFKPRSSQPSSLANAPDKNGTDKKRSYQESSATDEADEERRAITAEGADQPADDELPY